MAKQHDDVRDALDVGLSIQETIDGLDSSTRSKAFDFFSGVKSRSKSICKTIERNNDVSDAQRSALDNMLKAVRKWTHDDDEDDDD